MKNNKDLLESILKTTQMGQTGIRSVLPYAVKEDLVNALKSQKHEYDTIEQEAYAIAHSRGWELEELSNISKLLSKSYACTKLIIGDTDSKIAEMMINGNTRGLLKGLKNHHHSKPSDATIHALSQKLLDRENENIRQMQGYV